MSDSRPSRDPLVDDAPADDRAGTGMRDEPHDVRTNPHSDERAPETATRTGGLMVGMFFPVVILAAIALVVILYFVFLR